jgi:hypothetical protein
MTPVGLYDSSSLWVKLTLYGFNCLILLGLNLGTDPEMAWAVFKQKPIGSGVVSC